MAYYDVLFQQQSCRVTASFFPFFSFMPQLFTIRPMIKEDLDRVLELERQCHPSPWSAEIFRRELENSLSTIDLLWIGDELAGYLCTWFFAGELHIHNVTTAPGFRRLGVARTLLGNAFKKGMTRGMTRAFLEVRVGNAAAISLYERLGFRSLCRRTRYYDDGEDAFEMELSLLAADES